MLFYFWLTFPESPSKSFYYRFPKLKAHWWKKWKKWCWRRLPAPSRSVILFGADSLSCVYPHYCGQLPVMPSFRTGILLHVMFWNDFIRFNWESRKRLREAASGKTGPNHSVDDDRLTYICVCVRLDASANSPACFCRFRLVGSSDFWTWHGIKWTMFCQFMILISPLEACLPSPSLLLIL